MCQGHPWGQSEPDCQALTRQRKTQASGETEKKERMPKYTFSIFATNCKSI